MSGFFAGVLSSCIHEPIAPFEGDFASPQSGLVKVAEAADHHGNRQGNGENTKHGTDAADELSKSRYGSGRA